MTPLELILYLSIYLAAGVSLKLGDDLIDELDQANLAVGPLGISGVCFGVLMSVSEWDLVLFSAIIIGVLASGKVNSYHYGIGFVAIAVMLLLLGIPTVSDWLEWFALLIMLLLAAILDERGNDWADRNASPRANKFFEYRLTLKVSVLLLVLPWPPFLLAAVGLWFFDGGYELVGWLVRKHQFQPSDMQDYNTHP
jgi:hypothetical protein